MFSSIGQAKSAPTVVEEGKLLIYYTDGDICNESSGAKYNTFIYLDCDHGQLVSKPTEQSNLPQVATFLDAVIGLLNHMKPRWSLGQV